MQTNRISDENSYLRDTFNIPPGVAIFIYNGGLIPGRGLEVLVDIFKQPAIKSHLVFWDMVQ